MQSKLCLALALIVLIGALVGGNPFLTGGAGVPLRTASSTAVPTDASVSRDSAPIVLGGETPRAALVSLRAGSAPLAAKDTRPLDRERGESAGVDGELCPDVLLRPLVVRVRHAVDGTPIWVLRDGREVRRNPRRGPGQPLVVPVVPVQPSGGAVPGAGAPESGKPAGEQAVDDGSR